MRRAGATFLDEAGDRKEEKVLLTKADLFALGLSGSADSGEKRKALLHKLNLPEHMSANAMLEALNLLYDRAELEALLKEP